MKKIILVFLLLAAIAAFSRPARAQVVVIGNPNLKSPFAWKSDLRGIFTGESLELRDGSHVIPVLLKDGPVHDEFLSTIIGTNDAAFRSGWRSQVFSGHAMMPKTFSSELAVVEYVAHTAGSIGYIKSSTPHTGVKVLFIK